jgi:3-methyl-2-oxobutanoate hydroxymethyltransferase
MSHHKEVKLVTTHQLLAMKQRGEKISMLTAYDYSMAKILVPTCCSSATRRPT